MISSDIYFEIEQEIKQTPQKYLPTLLNIIHAFREGICADKLNSQTEAVEKKAEMPFDDLFGMIKATRTVSLAEMEQAISEQGLERFNDCH